MLSSRSFIVRLFAFLLLKIAHSASLFASANDAADMKRTEIVSPTRSNTNKHGGSTSSSPGNREADYPAKTLRQLINTSATDTKSTSTDTNTSSKSEKILNEEGSVGTSTNKEDSDKKAKTEGVQIVMNWLLPGGGQIIRNLKGGKGVDIKKTDAEGSGGGMVTFVVAIGIVAVLACFYPVCQAIKNKSGPFDPNASRPNFARLFSFTRTDQVSP